MQAGADIRSGFVAHLLGKKKIFYLCKADCLDVAMIDADKVKSDPRLPLRGWDLAMCGQPPVAA